MKTFLALGMLVGSLASATSIKMNDRWSCDFPYTDSTSKIKGAIVNIDFDLRTMQGTGSQVVNCPSCRVLPQVLPVERNYLTNLLVYKNIKSGFYMQIIVSPDYRIKGIYPAVLGNKVAGTCTPQ